mgnify:FL=1
MKTGLFNYIVNGKAWIHKKGVDKLQLFLADIYDNISFYILPPDNNGYTKSAKVASGDLQSTGIIMIIELQTGMDIFHSNTGCGRLVFR